MDRKRKHENCMPNGTKKQKKTDAKQADIREFFGKKKKVETGAKVEHVLPHPENCMPNGTKKQKKTAKMMTSTEDGAKQADIRTFSGAKQKQRQGQRWNTFFLVLTLTLDPLKRFRCVCSMQQQTR